MDAGAFLLCCALEKLLLLFGSTEAVEVVFFASCSDTGSGFGAEFAGFFGGVQGLFFCPVQECFGVAATAGLVKPDWAAS